MEGYRFTRRLSVLNPRAFVRMMNKYLRCYGAFSPKALENFQGDEIPREVKVQTCVVALDVKFCQAPRFRALRTSHLVELIKLLAKTSQLGPISS